MKTELAVRAGTLGWVRLPDAELRRRAAQAANSRDAEQLWALAAAHLSLKGRSRGVPSPHTIRAYRQCIKRLLGDWRGVNLLRPDRDQGDLWVLTLSSELAASSVSVHLAAARLLYRALRWAGATTADPFDSTRAPTDPTPEWERNHPYTPAEIEALLEAGDDTDRLVVLLGAHAGLRAQEMLDLTHRDVDLATGTLTVRSGKGGRRRTVLLSTALLEALECAPADEFVLPLRSYGGLRHRLTRLCDRAGVKRRGLHALRHSAGTAVLRATGSILDVAQHLGHEQLDTSRIYAKWTSDNLKRAVTAW